MNPNRNRKGFETEVPLGPLTSFGIGGPAERLYRPRTAGDALKVLGLAADRDRTVRVLGGGTNLLVDDEGVRGFVLHTGRMRDCRRLGGHRIRAQTGLPLQALLAFAAREGLSGLEDFAGIPGTVGGAVRGNVGGGGKAISDLLESVDAAHPLSGRVLFSRDQLRFGYRRSSLGGHLILGATFQLRPGNPRTIRDAMRERFGAKRRAQPLRARSAGCFFRNYGRIPAGLLIDRCGLKGFRMGGAMVSPDHANVLLNVGEATSRDVLRLARLVRRTVRDLYGIHLRSEVKVWRSPKVEGGIRTPSKAKDRLRV
ncbi:MAG: UDP-N-acetylmuramate dehydrogenase [Planctomycetota bacterium]|jgi:UDP-N-acetylmuramate dehydrogenase